MKKETPVNDYKYELINYTLVFLTLILLAPALKQLLYEPSKDWMRAIAPYKHPWVTSLMQLFATLGDGEFFFFIGAMFYVFGNPTDFVYLTLCFLVNLHWANVLKPLYHHSRPYYDDLSLAPEKEVGNCSGEFGSPSSHALMAGQFIPTILLFIRGRSWF